MTYLGYAIVAAWIAIGAWTLWRFLSAVVVVRDLKPLPLPLEQKTSTVDEAFAFGEALKRPGSVLVMHPNTLRSMVEKFGPSPDTPSAFQSLYGIPVYTSEAVKEGQVVTMQKGRWG